MRTANLYFLAVVMMQTIPGLSPTPWQATALPLVFVLTINAIKVRYIAPLLMLARLLHVTAALHTGSHKPI